MKTTFKRSILTLTIIMVTSTLTLAEAEIPPFLTSPDQQPTRVQASSELPAQTANHFQHVAPTSSHIGKTAIGQSKIGTNQPDKSDAETPTITPPVSTAQIFLSLVFVVVLILVTAKFWRRHLPGGGVTISNEVMTVLGERKVNKQHSICLVRLGSRILVLGAATDGLRTLSEITDPVEIDLLAGMSKTSSEDSKFSNSLHKFLKTPSPATASLKSSSRPKTRQPNPTNTASFERPVENGSKEVPHA